MDQVDVVEAAGRVVRRRGRRGGDRLHGARVEVVDAQAALLGGGDDQGAGAWGLRQIAGSSALAEPPASSSYSVAVSAVGRTDGRDDSSPAEAAYAWTGSAVPAAATAVASASDTLPPIRIRAFLPVRDVTTTPLLFVQSMTIRGD
ncbi:hypothetical protein GCM10010365_18040 [Streptomyces poonensis]|uniref:Uncharacterized protein n=1 Tax=Streptomyces poonensis TaxID=68255 RepID=A0A918PCK0_9ACTN|nr:hypothetical protein GCM10010365_18040 [Streptomyces poonensis]GLJ92208.1 hypothetical protein GCM10017589_48170 [Streptomyces poonensis]